MTQNEFTLFLNVAAAICAAFAIFNLTLLKRRGNAAFALSLAFLVTGGTILLYGRQGMSNLVIAGGSVVILLLGVDFFLRAPNQQTRRRR